MTQGTTNVRFIHFLGENLQANGIKCVGHFKRDNSSASIEIVATDYDNQARVYKVVINILTCTDRTQQALVNNFNKTQYNRQS